MKRFFKVASLLLLGALSAGIIFKRATGSIPTQVSGAFVYLILALNVTWILLNSFSHSWVKSKTKMGRS